MGYEGTLIGLEPRQRDVLEIYRTLHTKNIHKMAMPPIFTK